MFREECPEFLNIRLGCWCSNGGHVFSCRMESGDQFFLQPFVMGTSLGLLKQNMCQNDLLNLEKLRSSSHVSTTQIG